MQPLPVSLLAALSVQCRIRLRQLLDGAVDEHHVARGVLETYVRLLFLAPLSCLKPSQVQRVLTRAKDQTVVVEILELGVLRLIRRVSDSHVVSNDRRFGGESADNSVSPFVRWLWRHCLDVASRSGVARSTDSPDSDIKVFISIQSTLLTLLLTFPGLALCGACLGPRAILHSRFSSSSVLSHPGVTIVVAEHLDTKQQPNAGCSPTHRVLIQVAIRSLAASWRASTYDTRRRGRIRRAVRPPTAPATLLHLQRCFICNAASSATLLHLQRCCVCPCSAPQSERRVRFSLRLQSVWVSLSHKGALTGTGAEARPLAPRRPRDSVGRVGRSASLRASPNQSWLHQIALGLG